MGKNNYASTMQVPVLGSVIVERMDKMAEILKLIASNSDQFEAKLLIFRCITVEFLFLEFLCT